MSAGTLFLALWFWRTADLLGGAGPVDLIGPDATAALFIALGAVLAGAGSAALCVEMQRVYGSLESDVILFHGVGSYAVSLLAVLVIGLLPLPAMLAAWALSPLSAARCLLAEYGRLTHRELYARGEGGAAKAASKAPCHLSASRPFAWGACRFARDARRRLGRRALRWRVVPDLLRLGDSRRIRTAHELQ